MNKRQRAYNDSFSYIRRRSNYQLQTKLLVRTILPALSEEPNLALHGGSAINLFLLNMPRYSVDADATFVPILPRHETFVEVNNCLQRIADKIRQTDTGLLVDCDAANLKLYVEDNDHTRVKLEVNNVKRGIIGGTIQRLPLCLKAKQEFKSDIEMNIVPTTLLYGGKIAATLQRQHPRDIFDIMHMPLSLPDIKDGIIYCLLSGNRPLYELIRPNKIDQNEVLNTHFDGMTNEVFTYDSFVTVREQLFETLPTIFTENDKQFMIHFELAEPNWDNWSHPEYADHPSIQWRLKNLRRLKENDPQKLLHYAYLLQETLQPNKAIVHKKSHHIKQETSRKGFKL